MSVPEINEKDRLLASLRLLIRSEFPNIEFFGRHLYTVQATDGVTVDVIPAPLPDGSASKLPPIPGCPLYPGIIGEQSTPKVGSSVLVEFIGCDPRRPIVTGGDPANPPTLTKLAGGGPAVARVGDTVTITQAELTAAGAQAGGNAVTVSSPIQATITSGSSKVQSG